MTITTGDTNSGVANVSYPRINPAANGLAIFVELEVGDDPVATMKAIHEAPHPGVDADVASVTPEEPELQASPSPEALTVLAATLADMALDPCIDDGSCSTPGCHDVWFTRAFAQGESASGTPLGEAVPVRLCIPHTERLVSRSIVVVEDMTIVFSGLSS